MECPPGVRDLDRFQRDVGNDDVVVRLDGPVEDHGCDLSHGQVIEAGEELGPSEHVFELAAEKQRFFLNIKSDIMI